MVRATCTTWKFPCTLWTRIFELISMLQGTWKFPWNLSVWNVCTSLNVTRYVEISIYPFGQEILKWSQCYKVHGNFHVPFWTKIFELVSMIQGTWKFPCTLLDKNFRVGLSVTRYMGISMYPSGQEFLNWSQCYKVHGNFHGPFRYRMFELVSMLQVQGKVTFIQTLAV